MVAGAATEEDFGGNALACAVGREPQSTVSETAHAEAQSLRNTEVAPAAPSGGNES
jgi:hypothetical protein